MWEKATELQSLEPSRDWTCLLSKAKHKQQQAILKSASLRASYSSAQLFFLLPCSQLEQRRKEGGKKKSLFLSNRSRLQDPLPTLIFPALVAKSVGTAFRASSGGGRATLTYRPALATHIFMPDVATCQTHSAVKTSIDSNNPYTCLPPPTSSETIWTKVIFT